MPGRLTQLLDPDRIQLSLRSTRRASAIKEVARLLEDHPQVLNYEGFYKELLARERLDTTYLGHEVALPHARTEHVSQMVLAVGRSTKGLDFEKVDQTVHLLFVLATPKSNPRDYLQVVSALCRVLKEPGHREALLDAETPAEFIEAVRRAEQDVC